LNTSAKISTVVSGVYDERSSAGHKSDVVDCISHNSVTEGIVVGADLVPRNIFYELDI